MDKKTLLYYWDAVNSITEELKGITKINEFGVNVAESYEPYLIGVDEVAVYNCKEETIIAINGSDKDKGEWRGNFNGYPIVDGCHYNFRKDGIRILETVIAECPKLKPITVVGHSRGGALAQIFAHYAKELHGREVSCVTYGSPRPFTLAKHKHLQFFHTRVNTDGDIVCHIPPVWLPLFWKSYDTTNCRIKPKKILGIKKKHGDYGYIIKEFMK